MIKEHLLPPATKLRQGNVFYTCLSFCSVHGGGCLPHRLGRHPLGRHPPGQTPPTDTPRWTPPLPSACWDTPHLCSACWDMVNKQAVHILLECILVSLLHVKICSHGVIGNTVYFYHKVMDYVGFKVIITIVLFEHLH